MILRHAHDATARAALVARPRRLRSNATMRALVRETRVNPDGLVQPLFVVEGSDLVQPIYIRKVEKINGELWNTEFAKFDDVKDPLKVKK